MTSLCAVVVLCGTDSLIGPFLLAAANSGMTNGDYVYIITELLQPINAQRKWVTGTGLDDQARLAYQSALQVCVSRGAGRGVAGVAAATPV